VKKTELKIDKDVPLPERRSTYSFTSAIEMLAVGECAARAENVDKYNALAVIQDTLPARKESLRNNIAPSVKAAKGRTGGEYTVEVTDMLTPARNWMIIGIVTRVA